MVRNDGLWIRTKRKARLMEAFFVYVPSLF